MAECENCGEPIRKPVSICPKCGYNPGPETITDMFPARKRAKRRKKKKKEKGAGKNCEHCGAEKPGYDDICPKCGLGPGPETITDIVQSPSYGRKKKNK